MSSEDSIELTRVLAAPPNRVYQALTDPRMLERWFPSRVESEVSVGGRIRFWFESTEKRDDFEDHFRDGVFRELIPGRKVVYTFGLPEGETVVTWILTPRSTGTELKLIHSGFGTGPSWAKSRGAHSGGWGFYLENLAGILVGQKDKRPKEMGQKTVV